MQWAMAAKEEDSLQRAPPSSHCRAYSLARRLPRSLRLRLEKVMLEAEKEHLVQQPMAAKREDLRQRATTVQQGVMAMVAEVCPGQVML